MSAWDQIQWDQGFFGGDAGDPDEAAIAVIDLLAQLYPRLHADAAATLVWWTEAELVAWIDAAAKRAGTVCGGFVKRSTRVTEQGAATYTLPEGHVATLQVAWNGLAMLPATTRELEARDESYATSQTEDPTHWYQDTIGEAAIGLWHVPDDAKELAVVHRSVPDAVQAAGAIAAPDILAGFFEDTALAEAYGKQSDAAMPDVAAHLRMRLALWERLMKAYWG